MEYGREVICSAMLVLVPLCLGTFVNYILKRRETRAVSTYLTGFCSMLLLLEGMIIVAMKLDLPFSMLSNLYSVLLCLLCVAACTIGRKQLYAVISRMRKTQERAKSTEIRIIYAIIAVLFVAQLIIIFYFNPMIQEDNTMEVIQTTITSNEIHRYNAMTGQLSQNGISMQGKFMVLPIFYSFLCRTFQLNAGVLLYRMMPIWLLLLSYLVYEHLGAQLFQKEIGDENRYQTAVFVLFYGVLLLFGDYLFTMIPYRIFHCSWAGETVVVSIVLPFVMSQCMQLKRAGLSAWVYTAVSVIAVFLMVSFQKGLVYVGITMVMMLCVFLIMRVRRKALCKNM